MLSPRKRVFKDIPGEAKDMEALAFDLFCNLVVSHPRLGQDWEEAVLKVKGEKEQFQTTSV